MSEYRVSAAPPVDPIAARIEAILADVTLEREGSETSKLDELEKLYQRSNWLGRLKRDATVRHWEPVRDYLMTILEDPSRSADDWTTIATVFWGAILDRLPLVVNPDRLIALLCTRLPPEGGAENNLAWSITAKLKGKSAASSFNPMNDPGVIRELETVTPTRRRASVIPT